MQFAIHNLKVWQVLKKTVNYAIIGRGNETKHVNDSKISIIFPELEAVKLLNRINDHEEIMALDAQIKLLETFRRTIQLPTAIIQNEKDEEITLFHQEVFQQTIEMLGPQNTRQQSKSISLDFHSCQLDHIIQIFNIVYPEANKIEVNWEDGNTTTYLCTKIECSLSNLVVLPKNYQSDIANPTPLFLDTLVKEGARLLWARVILDYHDFSKINSFKDVDNGRQYLPFSDKYKIYYKSKLKPEYIDWITLVVDRFNHDLVHEKLLNLSRNRISSGPFYEAVDQNITKFNIADYWSQEELSAL